MQPLERHRPHHTGTYGSRENLFASDLGFTTIPIEEHVAKHAGPGRHPGTGTAQQAHAGKLTEDQRAVRDYMTALAQMQRSPSNPNRYQSFEQFVLEHGAFFEPAELPDDVARGEMKECFSNAGQCALDLLRPTKYRYAEGYALPKDSPLPVLHAWLVDDEGRAIDPTWGGGAAYFGITYSTEWLRRHVLRTKTWGVLGGDFRAVAEIMESGLPEEAIAKGGMKPGGGGKLQPYDDEGRYSDAGADERGLDESDRRRAELVLSGPSRHYFAPDPYRDHPTVPLSRVRLSKPPESQPDSVRNAIERMAEAARGDIEKRGPISVKANPDFTFTVVDGNATTGAAMLAGWTEIPATIEGASHHGAFIHSDEGYAWRKEVRNEETGEYEYEDVISADVEAAALEVFGSAGDMSVAGYLTTDGDFLDFSEGGIGGPVGMRSADHRSIGAVSNASEYGLRAELHAESMLDFMDRGNVRLSPEAPGIDVMAPLNSTQRRALRDWFEVFPEAFVEVTGRNGHTVWSSDGMRDYRGALEELDRAFENANVRRETGVGFGKHAGPGAHPGTGSPQAAHAGGRIPLILPGPVAVDVFRNPTRSRLRAIQRNARLHPRGGDVRVLLNLHGGDGYVWDAYLATHSQVADGLGIEHTTLGSLIIFDDGGEDRIEMDYLPDFESEEGRRGVADFVLGHPAIRALYPDGVRIFHGAPPYALGVSVREPLEITSDDHVSKHYGPGPHPGTGTEQEVHAGGAPAVSTSNARRRVAELRPDSLIAQADRVQREGAARVREAYGIEEVDLSRTGTNPEVAQGVVDALLDFAEEYPTTAAEIVRIEVGEEGNAGEATFRIELEGEQIGRRKPRPAITLSFNDSTWEKLREKRWEKISDRDLGRWIAYHELGHALSFRHEIINLARQDEAPIGRMALDVEWQFLAGEAILDMKSSRAIREARQRGFEIAAAGPHIGPFMVTEYAKTSAAEFFSETFAAVKTGAVPVDPKLAQVVLDYAERAEQNPPMATVNVAKRRSVSFRHTDDWVKPKYGWVVEKHAGPGPHPGTGTPQTVHGRDRHIASTRKEEFSGRKNVPAGYPPSSKDYSDWTEEERNIQAAHSQAVRAKEKEWTQAIQRQIARGELTVEEAKKLGWYFSMDARRIMPLPEKLYHVTTAKDAVLRDGLKTRDELNMSRGVGLGGGDDETVSFTADAELARAIESTMHEAIDVAAGKISVVDLWDRAMEGTKTKAGGLPTPFHAQFVHMMFDRNWKRGDPLPVQMEALLAGKRIGDTGEPRGRAIGIVTEDEARAAGYSIIPGERPVHNSATGDALYNSRQVWRDATPEEARADRVSAFQAYLYARELAGGPPNPVFFGSDWEALANVSHDQVALLEAKPKKGAVGYAPGGMKEYRIWTGEVIESLQVVDDEPVLLGKHYGPGPHPGTGTEQTVHGSGKLQRATRPPTRGSRTAVMQGTLDKKPLGRHASYIVVDGKPAPFSAEILPEETADKLVALAAQFRITRDSAIANYKTLIDHVATFDDERREQAVRFYDYWHDFLQDLSDRTGASMEVVTAVAAEISPNGDAPLMMRYTEFIAETVGRNPEFSERTADRVNAMLEKKGIAFRVEAGMKLADLPEEAGGRALHVLRTEEHGSGFGIYRSFHPIDSAFAMLTGKADFRERLNGAKVRSYYNNLIDPPSSREAQDVTIDFQMIDAAMFTTGASVKGNPAKKLDSGASIMGVKLGIRPLLADYVREVTPYASEVFGQELGPLDVQSIIWHGWKDWKAKNEVGVFGE